MSKINNLTHECIMSLKKQEKYGESKFQAKKDAKALADERGEVFKNVQGLYSFKSMETYKKNCVQFIKYCLAEHKSEIKHYSDCRKYAEEYIQHDIDRGMSAYTIHTRAFAICSSFGIRKDELKVELPPRKREDIVRTRGTNTSKYKDIDERYRDVKDFIKATGCRREELMALRKDDIRQSKDGKYLFVNKRGKGGVERWCRVLPEYNELVKDIFRTQPDHYVNGENKLFKNSEIPRSAIHDLRADYASSLYDFYKDHGCSNGDIYYCKRERKGDSFDKGVLAKVSYDMGHHRIDVVVNNYLHDVHGRN